MPDPSASGSRDERLRSLLDPVRCVVLLQELQEGVVGTGSRLPELARVAAAASLVPNAQRVVQAAREVGVPVVHCTAETLPNGFGSNTNARLFAAARKSGMEIPPGSDSVKPVGALGPAEADIVLPRLHGLSPLTGSPLDALLRNRDVRTLVVMGVSLNIAIPNLVFDAVNRSYQVIVVPDAVAGVPVEYGRQVVEHSLSLVSTLADSYEIRDVWAAYRAERNR
jgi:nicotinamidase-related amidase